jgi:hypothetical protein
MEVNLKLPPIAAIILLVITINFLGINLTGEILWDVTLGGIVWLCVNIILQAARQMSRN